MFSYIILGIVFNFIWDLLSDKIENGDNIRLTWAGRISALALWPIYTIVFIYNFIKTINERND